MLIFSIKAVSPQRHRDSEKTLKHAEVISNPFVLSLSKHATLLSRQHAIKAAVYVGAAPRREKEL